MIHKHSIKQKFQFTVVSVKAEVLSHCFPSPGAANQFNYPYAMVLFGQGCGGSKTSSPYPWQQKQEQQSLGESQNIFIKETDNFLVKE